MRNESECPQSVCAASGSERQEKRTNIDKITIKPYHKTWQASYHPQISSTLQAMREDTEPSYVGTFQACCETEAHGADGR